MTSSSLDSLSNYFDTLAELVPAKFFYDNDDAKLNPRFLAKAARQAVKKEFKENYKKGKLARLNPNNETTTTLHVQKQLLSKQNVEKKFEEAEGAAGLKLKITSESRQELLEKLHKKMEEARMKRNLQADAAQKAKEWKEKTLTAATQKRKNADESDEAAAAAVKKARTEPAKPAKAEGAVATSAKPAAGASKVPQGASRVNKGGAAAAAAALPGIPSTEDFAFSKLETENGKGKTNYRSERATKEQLLKQAQAKKVDQEALKTTAEGKEKLHADAWQAAMSRARGEKVLDDPKLLKRSIKRDAKKREKSSKAWKERKDTQAEKQAAKQNKRKDNLKARSQTKIDKKKERREKKLFRAGFEGRKTGFIGGGGASSAAK